MSHVALLVSDYALPQAFVSAGSSVVKKRCVFLTYQAGKQQFVWEFFWSPSLGVNAQSLVADVQHWLRTGEAKTACVRSHASWIEAVITRDKTHASTTTTNTTNTDNAGKKPTILTGVEFGVTGVPNHFDGVDFHRFKCDTIIHKTALDAAHRTPLIIVDFNGSADAARVIPQLQQLQHSGATVWVEEPFPDTHVPADVVARRVFDRKVDSLTGVQATDLICLKIGRDSYADYAALIANANDVCFGGVVCSPFGDALNGWVLHTFATLQLRIQQRDNCPVALGYSGDLMALMNNFTVAEHAGELISHTTIELDACAPQIRRLFEQFAAV